MSTPFMPDYLTEQMKQFETMTKSMTGSLSADLQGAANLMAHPMAAFAASSAIGIGMASQMWGLWMGSATGMAEAAQRMMAIDVPQGRADADAFHPAKSASAQAKAAVRTLVADAESVARDVSAVAEKSAKDAAADVEKAVKATAKAVTPAVAPPKNPAADLADDLKAIGGIGPKLEQVLNGLGIKTYAQVAALTEAEIAALDEKLGFKGRILRDDWVGQARRLG